MASFWSTYWPVFLVVIWPTLSAILNMVLRRKTAEEWVVFAESRPRTAGFIRLLRAIGLDPIKGFQALKEVVRGVAAKNQNQLPPAVKLADSLTADASVDPKEPPK